MFESWLIAWAVGVAVMAAFVSVSWSAATYGRLARAGAPRPATILMKLWLTRLAWALPSGDAARREALVGRRAWVWWDVRWGPAGQTEAVVVAADEWQLHLALATPMPLQSPDALVREVVFTPSRPASYRWATATGTVAPRDAAGRDVDRQQQPRTRVCLL